MKKYVYTGVLSILFMGVMLVPGAHAETTSNEAMLEQIKVLMAKIEELKKQLADVQGEVRAVLKANIAEGTTSDDVKKIQEILATDETIYPEGKVTGYYGPLTKEALKRFQKRHELEVTGVVDEDTRALLEEYLEERFGEKVPPGLLKAPGIMKKVELRAKEGCDNKGHGKGILCTKLKIKYEDEHEHDDDEDEDHEHDESDDDSDDATSTPEATVRDAGKAIIKAAQAIYVAKEEVNDAEVDTEEAKDLLDEARDKLALARKARNDRDYSEAVELAEQAEALADDAKDALDDDSDNADSDDDDDDEEDDDDDES